MDWSSWVQWGGWEIFYTLFWRSPFCYITWLSLIVLAVGARTEYVKHGGGINGVARGVWFAVKNFPRTMNEILRWITIQIVLLAGLITRTDVLGMMPVFVRRWLGHGPVETKTVYRDRIVERVKWRKPPIKWRLAKTVVLVLVGVALDRAYLNDMLGPWASTAATWMHTFVVWVYNKI